MADDFRPAERKSAKPLIGIYAESGCGKTYSALLLARGFVGPKGRIAMIETESGRGEAYADRREYPELAPDGGGQNYDVLSLHDNFSPAVYGAAIKAAEQAKYDALIVDSVSHEWEGPGGVLAMAAKNAETMKGVIVWQKPKLSHQRDFMLTVMQTPIPLVVLCMRAKYPMEQQTINGKKDWVRSTVLEPKQSEDILYEMFVHGWIDQAHKFHLTKSTSKSLVPVFKDGAAITAETGRQLAAWARGDHVDTPAQSTPSQGIAAEPKRDAFGLEPIDKGADEHLEDLKDEGRDAASGGMAVVISWWKRLSKADQTALVDYKEKTLKPMAEAVDANTPPDDEGDGSI